MPNIPNPPILPPEEKRKNDIKCQQMFFSLLQTYPPEKWLVLDLETTGLNIGYDEILQISMLDGNGNILLNEYVKPDYIQKWPEAEKIHGITPQMVADAPALQSLLPKIVPILRNAELVIGYNSNRFDLPMLDEAGFCIFPGTTCCDVMQEFATYNGEWLEEKHEYRWKSLAHCCEVFQYQPEPGSFSHNSLYDALATLHCFRALMDAVLSNTSTEGGEEK